MSLSSLINVPVLKQPWNWFVVAFVVALLLFLGHLVFGPKLNPNVVSNVQETN
jgi:hypothetical protein